MKPIWHIVYLLGIFWILNPGQEAYAQMKIGNNPTSINSNSLLELESNTKGILLPRIALTASNAASPMSSFVQGMFVYNTATSNDVTPGIYYSDGSKWIKANSNSSNAWSLTGNSGTDTAIHFIGNTDNKPQIFKTNNTERLRITADGKIGIGTSTPEASLHINGGLVVDSLDSGNPENDKLLVIDPLNGKVKSLAAYTYIKEAENRVEVVQSSGQTIFNTPDVITDINKILLYRNGIMISCTLNDAFSIISEIPCQAGDEIKIVQLK